MKCGKVAKHDTKISQHDGTLWAEPLSALTHHLNTLRDVGVSETER